MWGTHDTIRSVLVVWAQAAHASRDGGCVLAKQVPVYRFYRAPIIPRAPFVLVLVARAWWGLGIHNNQQQKRNIVEKHRLLNMGNGTPYSFQISDGPS